MTVLPALCQWRCAFRCDVLLYTLPHPGTWHECWPIRRSCSPADPPIRSASRQFGHSQADAADLVPPPLADVTPVADERGARWAVVVVVVDDDDVMEFAAECGCLVSTPASVMRLFLVSGESFRSDPWAPPSAISAYGVPDRPPPTVDDKYRKSFFASS